jgi:hypothetical protein
MGAIAIRWKHVPTAASFLVICGLVIGGAIYLINYWDRDAYLTSRNFRLLAVLAKQTEGAIEGHVYTKAARLGHPPSQLTPLLRVGKGRPEITLSLDIKRDVDTTGVAQIVTLVFAPKIDQGAFDTLALATTDGRVVFAIGRREWELNSMNLALLLPDRPVPAASDKPIASPNPQASAFTRIAVLDAIVAGERYKMFIQPCCQLLTQEARAPAERLPSGAVIVGLVAAGTLREEAMAISPTLVVIASLLVALGFLAWPFLSVALPGPRKRITEWDALQLGFCGTIGLAVASILAVTSVQWAHLENDLKTQLSTLAIELDQALTSEIEASSIALDAFENWFAACPTGEQALGYVVEKNCRASAITSQARVPAYGNYTTAALVGSDGRQVRKAWPALDKPPLVDVRDRPYFRTALSYSSARHFKERLDATHFACMGPPCVVQSLVSYTTGEPSAVLARPSRGGPLPVAAITLPMRSVINPALPPGFEFAVIEKTGRVVFHSDVQRNTFEDLFLETDRNRQLRSLVATGVDGSVRTEYWGRPYLAHVKHARAYGWSVVTMFDRRNLRGLMLEWTMVSLLFLGAYTLLWAVALFLAVTTGASWMWPDRFRARRYVCLSVFYIVLIGAFGAAFAAPVSRSTMAQAGFALPAVACAVTLLVLRRRPDARVGVTRLDYRYSFCIAGALLIVITGVVPGAAFVARSYDAHIEAYIKHRQFGIVQALLTRPPLETQPESAPMSDTNPTGTRAKARELEGWHGDFFYETSLCREDNRSQALGDHEKLPSRAVNLASSQLEACPLGTPSVRGEVEISSASADSPWSLERYLPYFSEMSVQIRELVRSRADDGSWASAREDQKTVLRVAQGGVGQREPIWATTVLPSLAIARVGALTPILLGLVALAYGVAFFIAHYVFLGKVSAPMWALGRLGIPEGRTVILICDPPSMTPRIVRGVDLRLGPLLASTEPETALAERLAQIKRDGAADRPLVITDLDATGEERGLADRTRLLAHLTRMRRYAVLALTPPPLPDWSDALEAVADACPQAMSDVHRAAKDLKAAGAMVLDWMAHPGAAAGPLVLSSVPSLVGWWRRAVLPGRPTVSRQQTARIRPDGEALLQSEELAHPGLRPVCDSIRRLDAFRMNRLTRSELLEEIDERAESLYLDIWKSCTDIEKLELRHIAQFGLANPGNSRAVRQLIMKRLVTKDPNLRVMNRTFRRFIVSPQSGGALAQADVARIEGELGASLWDQFRAPFALAVTGVAAFLFLTQRETYNTTVGAVVGLATQVPNVLKALTMMVYKDGSGPPGQRV